MRDPVTEEQLHTSFEKEAAARSPECGSPRNSESSTSSQNSDWGHESPPPAEAGADNHYQQQGAMSSEWDEFLIQSQIYYEAELSMSKKQQLPISTLGPRFFSWSAMNEALRDDSEDEGTDFFFLAEDIEVEA
mmetsp:Transcript_35216/g.55030  ORF Transcript_35216/g.55030 Transcript_35216/m.55030 type:complete len:133 (-) Transcript_35216:65-463(-)